MQRGGEKLPTLPIEPMHCELSQIFHANKYRKPVLELSYYQTSPSIKEF